MIVVGTGATIGAPPPTIGMGNGIGGTMGILFLGNNRICVNKRSCVNRWIGVSNRTGDNKWMGDSKGTGVGLPEVSDSVGLALADGIGSVDERRSSMVSGVVALEIFSIGNIFFDIFGTCWYVV